MPIKGMSPPAIMKHEMGRFKAGELHSGSKSGPKVKSRQQAVAIGLSEARKGGSRYPGMGGPDPVERSVAAPDVALVHRAAGAHRDSGFVEHSPKITHGPDRAPPKSGPAPGVVPAHARHGYGHDATQHSGHLRNSGDSRAHRIGKR